VSDGVRPVRRHFSLRRRGPQLFRARPFSGYDTGRDAGMLIQSCLIVGTHPSHSLKAAVEGKAAVLGDLHPTPVAPMADSPRDLLTPLLPNRVFVSGMPVDVCYAGAAPGIVSGIDEINIPISSESAVHSSVPNRIEVGTCVSEQSVTISVNSKTPCSATLSNYRIG